MLELAWRSSPAVFVDSHTSACGLLLTCIHVYNVPMSQCLLRTQIWLMTGHTNICAASEAAKARVNSMFKHTWWIHTLRSFASSKSARKTYQSWIHMLTLSKLNTHAYLIKVEYTCLPFTHKASEQMHASLVGRSAAWLSTILTLYV